MQQKSLVKNAMYNFLYTGLNLFFPLITAPYVSRVLGAANLGKVNFASSIVSWFILFSVFGVSSYGVREIAKHRDDRIRLNKIFSELVLINGCLSLIVSLIYLFTIFNMKQLNGEINLYFVMLFSILLNMFSIDWFYQGIEEYSFITARSAIFKILSLICIFAFVNSVNDYVIYGFISVLATSLSNISNYFYSKKFVVFEVKNLNLMRHFRPLSIFFLISLVSSVYSNLDQTLLGFLVNTKSVAFMNRSRAIVSMAISVATSISNVTLPRASYYLKQNKKKFNELLESTPKYILWISIPITIGCIIMASNIMYLLGGVEFIEAKILLQSMAIIIILSPIASFLQNQILIPTGNERLGLFCAIISSILSLSINVIFIPKFGYLTAAIAVAVAELSAVLTRYYIVKFILKYNDLKLFSKSLVMYLISATMMGIFVLLIDILIENPFISLMTGIAGGGGLYFIVLFIMREEMTIYFYNKMRDRLKQKNLIP